METEVRRIRKITLAAVAVLFVVAIPWMSSAQVLDDAIEQLRHSGLIRSSDPYLDAMVACIIDKGHEGAVDAGFEEDTGITLARLLRLLASETGERLRAGTYEDYGIGDAVTLGLLPLTNPNAFMKLSTAYAVPGHVLLADRDNDNRTMLLDGVISGDIAATRHVDAGRYEPVRPAEPAWPEVLEQIRGEPWSANVRGHWDGDTLIVDARPQATDELQFVVPGESELANASPRAAVIVWDADDGLPSSVRVDYAESLYLGVADAAFHADCIARP